MSADANDLRAQYEAATGETLTDYEASYLGDSDKPITLPNGQEVVADCDCSACLEGSIYATPFYPGYETE